MAKQSSNKSAYWIIGGIVVLALVGFGGYKLWHHFNKNSAMHFTTTQNSIVSQSPAQGNQTGSSGLPNKTDTSYQQLNSDVQNIQNSMNQLQQDQATANQDTGNKSQDVPQQ